MAPRMKVASPRRQGTEMKWRFVTSVDGRVVVGMGGDGGYGEMGRRGRRRSQDEGCLLRQGMAVTGRWCAPRMKVASPRRQGTEMWWRFVTSVDGRVVVWMGDVKARRRSRDWGREHPTMFAVDDPRCVVAECGRAPQCTHARDGPQDEGCLFWHAHFRCPYTRSERPQSESGTLTDLQEIQNTFIFSND